MKLSEQVAALEKELDNKTANPILIRAWENAYWILLNRLVDVRMEVIKASDPDMYSFLETPIEVSRRALRRPSVGRR